MKRRDFIKAITFSVPGTLITRGLTAQEIDVPQAPIPQPDKPGVAVMYNGCVVGEVLHENLDKVQWQIAKDADFEEDIKMIECEDLPSVLKEPVSNYRYLRFYVEGVGPSKNIVDLGSRMRMEFEEGRQFMRARTKAFVEAVF